MTDNAFSTKPRRIQLSRTSTALCCSAQTVIGSSTMMPVRIQLSRKRGFRLQEHSHALNGLDCVKVDRTNKTHGNIFKVGCNPSHFSAALPSTCDSVAEAVECFRYYADTWMAITGGRWIDPLRNKNLACWCPLDQPCHADVLLELANSPPLTTTRGDEK